MKLALDLLSAEYLDTEIRLTFQAKHITDESADVDQDVLRPIPKAPFQRGLQQVRYLDKALRATFTTCLFPVGTPKIMKSDPRWGINVLLNSATWQVQRFFSWILSKPQVCRSDLLTDFLHNPLFGTNSGWDGGVLQEFKDIFESIRDTFRSGPLDHLPILQCASLEQERTVLETSLKMIKERHDTIEGLLQAVQAELAWSRNLARASEDVGRSICDADIALNGSTTMESKQFYESLSKQRDIQESMLSNLSDELAVCLSLQLKEHVKAIRFLQIWAKSLSNLDSCLHQIQALSMECADAVRNSAEEREREAREKMTVSKDVCKKEISWFCGQSDLELSERLSSCVALRATSLKEEINLF